jgi:TonB family protein
MTMANDWTKEWERRIVNGVYPLRRFLGRSNHSVVFLTETDGLDVVQAAIKILPANPARAESQLEHWRMAATLSHPHLLRLLDAGRCRLGGHDFLFVVMDHAEQNLAQILPSRPLTPDEVRELLPPALDALAYLHDKNLAHGGLKPPNFLVVDDQLKLASDTVRPAGERTASTARPSVYDPPEAKKGEISSAGDIWGLGITLVEALTQAPPAWSRDSSDSISLPATLPPEFVDTVQRCLNRDPAQRPTIAELVAHFKPAPAAPTLSVAPPPSEVLPPSAAAPQPAEPLPAAASPYAEPPPPAAASPPASPPAAPLPTAAHPYAEPPPSASPSAPPETNEPAVLTSPTPNPPKTRFLVTALAVGMVGAVWTGVHLSHTHANVPPVDPTQPVQPPTSITPQPPAAVPPPAVPAPASVETPKATVAAAPPTVLHQEIPDVSHRARESVRGVIKILVRVTVDRSGNVAAATLDSRGSSKYFSRAALDAAKKWKFSEGPDQASRVWLLHFEFTRGGVAADATTR